MATKKQPSKGTEMWIYGASLLNKTYLRNLYANKLSIQLFCDSNVLYLPLRYSLKLGLLGYKAGYTALNKQLMKTPATMKDPQNSWPSNVDINSAFLTTFL